MLRLALLLAIPVTMAAAACGSSATLEKANAAANTAVPAPAVTTRDIHSYARPDEARVTDVALDLRADFASRTLSGQAALTLKRAPDAREVVLDTKGLTIESVTDAK